MTCSPAALVISLLALLKKRGKGEEGGKGEEAER